MGSTVKDSKVVTLDINDVMRMAAADKKFAAALGKNPEKFKDAFSLSMVDIESITNADIVRAAVDASGDE